MKFKDAVKLFWDRIARVEPEQDYYVVDGEKFNSLDKAENASDKNGE